MKRAIPDAELREALGPRAIDSDILEDVHARLVEQRVAIVVD